VFSTLDILIYKHAGLEFSRPGSWSQDVSILKFESLSWSCSWTSSLWRL